MGLFDFRSKKKQTLPPESHRETDESPPKPSEHAETSPNVPFIPGVLAEETPEIHLPPPAAPFEPIAPGEIAGILDDACAHLERKDLPAAMQMYENLFARAGDTPEALMTVSADLGANGYIDALIELIAPMYDPERHGPIPGVNLLQAYLTVQNTSAAQQLLDVLRGVADEELQARLHGLEGALEQQKRAHASGPRGGSVGLVSISKPIWFYGFEGHPVLLPTKNSAAKRIAFAPLAVPREAPERGKAAELDPFLVTLSRAIPLFFADGFYFTENYNSVGLITTLGTEYFVAATEWLPDQVRGLSTKEGGEHNYAVTGFLHTNGEEITVGVRVWETAKARARKLFSLTVPKSELASAVQRIMADVLYYMEAKELPPGAGPFAVRTPALTTGELLGYAQSAELFIVQKQILPRETVVDLEGNLTSLANHLSSNAPTLRFATLALSAQIRARELGIEAANPSAIADAARAFPALLPLVG